MPIALITGCSSGIGRASAGYFAERGFRVFATVRAEADTVALAARAAESGADVVPVRMDVARPDSIEHAIAEIIERAGRVDVLINNAGIAIPGAFEDMDLPAFMHVMRVNFWGPVRVTRALLPHMRRQGGGRIIMVSSLSALVGLPGMGAYSASKAALELAAESLRHEVARFGIHVSVIEPGAIHTPMPEKIAAGFSTAAESPYAPLLAHLRGSVVCGAGGGEDPLQVAELLYEVATAAQPDFRWPAGARARRVIAALSGLEGRARDAFVRAVDGTAWWSEGKESVAGGR
jgi:NAD(P)-dependent dehydrogenase (short-subunit alcohol dehydrogenase family)